MGRHISRRAALGLAAVAATGFGCGFNPFLLPELIFGGRSGAVPAEFPLTPRKGADEAKVVVLVNGRGSDSLDSAGLNHALNDEMIKVLEARCKANDEKVSVKKMTALRKFQSENPDPTLHPADIGKKLGADYVIEVEIGELNLFKPGTNRAFLQARANLTMSAYDLSKSLPKEAAFTMTYTTTYPRIGERPVESASDVETFRRELVTRIASDLTIKFTASTTEQRIRVD